MNCRIIQIAIFVSIIVPKFLPSSSTKEFTYVEENYKDTYQVMLAIDRSCNWYDATAGSWISFSCLLPELSSKSVCLFGTIVSVSCSINGLAKAIVFETTDDVVLEMSDLIVTEVADSVTPKKLKAIVIGAEKARAIWNLADEENRRE